MSDPSATSPQSSLLCPACRVDLVMSERQGIEIDYCPKCRRWGGWTGANSTRSSNAALPNRPLRHLRISSDPGAMGRLATTLQAMGAAMVSVMAGMAIREGAGALS